MARSFLSSYLRLGLTLSRAHNYRLRFDSETCTIDWMSRSSEVFNHHKGSVEYIALSTLYLDQPNAQLQKRSRFRLRAIFVILSQLHVVHNSTPVSILCKLNLHKGLVAFSAQFIAGNSLTHRRYHWSGLDLVCCVQSTGCLDHR